MIKLTVGLLNTFARAHGIQGEKAMVMALRRSQESGGGEQGNEHVIMSTFHALCFPKESVNVFIIFCQIYI